MTPAPTLFLRHSVSLRLPSFPPKIFHNTINYISLQHHGWTTEAVLRRNMALSKEEGDAKLKNEVKRLIDVIIKHEGP